jgi:hypothetical protein
MDWTAILKFFIEFSSSTLIWAIVILLIIWPLREPIKKFLESFTNIWDKATKVELFGLNLHLGTPVPPITQQGQSVDYKVFQNPAISEEADTIKKQLSEKNLSQEQIINLLITHLASANYNLVMTFIDRFIFPEQIELLEHLNMHRSTSHSETELRQFFNKWQKRSNDTSYNFSSFLNFLVTQRLMIPTVQGYLISQLGIEYLSFIVRVGRPSLETKNSEEQPNRDE